MYAQYCDTTCIWCDSAIGSNVIAVVSKNVNTISLVPHKIHKSFQPDLRSLNNLLCSGPSFFYNVTGIRTRKPGLATKCYIWKHFGKLNANTLQTTMKNDNPQPAQIVTQFYVWPRHRGNHYAMCSYLCDVKQFWYIKNRVWRAPWEYWGTWIRQPSQTTNPHNRHLNLPVVIGKTSCENHFHEVVCP